MEIQLQRPKREDLSIRFTLTPFIPEWGSTQANFITAITRELGDLLPVRPQDFYINSSGNLGEAWCKYTGFGGTSAIVLRPDALELRFVNENEDDLETIVETLRRLGSVLQQDIGGYVRGDASLTSTCHIETVGAESVERYLNQFALKRPADIAKTDVDMEYNPTVKVILSHKGRNWLVHRLVEKSDLLPDGLFVHTLVFIPSFELAEFEERKELVDHLFDLADEAVGLHYV